jgi:hypothetical protein
MPSNVLAVRWVWKFAMLRSSVYGPVDLRLGMETFSRRDSLGQEQLPSGASALVVQTSYLSRNLRYEFEHVKATQGTDWLKTAPNQERRPRRP